MNKSEIITQISELKKKYRAVIVAHNYQIDEIQEMADMVGDSFALSKFCASVSEEMIVFCGVRFMAESAKILSPSKTVLLPEADAGCPMADMVTPEALLEARKKYPKAAVVCYVNSSVEVKAVSDICCTSSNAVSIVKKLPADEILFVPDQNLGSYIAEKVPEKKIHLWEGYCITHHRVTVEEVRKIREIHPDAVFLVHPECRPEVVKCADFAGSTKEIIEYATRSKEKKFIIGTEMGVLYKLKNSNQDKTFFLMSQGLICPNMKKTKLESVYNALLNGKHKIEIEESIRLKAAKSLEKMLKIA
ncbi:MAG: quinolinate synthase NadA [Candidatus Riflebacteria bacterium]|nr:quinolinate synthase NadA [Candidatus Riflebacteria bacterium]